MTCSFPPSSKLPSQDPIYLPPDSSLSFSHSLTHCNFSFNINTELLHYSLIHRRIALGSFYCSPHLGYHLETTSLPYLFLPILPYPIPLISLSNRQEPYYPSLLTYSFLSFFFSLSLNIMQLQYWLGAATDSTTHNLQLK